MQSTLPMLLLGVAAILLPSGALAQADTEGGPKLIRKVDPKYTDRALAERIEGTVTLKAEIGTDGRAHDIRVVKSLDTGLDEKAIEALSKWEFRPALRRGNPIAVAATIEITFRLPRP